MKQKIWFGIGLVVMAIFGAGNADADAINLVCGERAVTINSINNVFQSLDVDGARYSDDASVSRSVHKGELITAFNANNASLGLGVSLIMGESGLPVAGIFKGDSPIWQQKCRFVE
ncbi:hypothetical protein [Enterobacter bugandensis]|uniref:hypothetical protein n=1 Tax=Enterobacter bugandensis TaxID=881260 RepID=UPI0020043B19|nr:hypothetical protein [Enterobacter bugandensis]MCK7435933.1 hypothetical protein [Enterobacter bugandensis]